ncbi:MAG: DUF3857 domain-containing protein [Verrucomicrobiales bacterium]|jgi:transglutaminase-like putative cysteine protease|nr:DUF3857 domain-containing protein [Verrucomicrobiales bacterium]
MKKIDPRRLVKTGLLTLLMLNGAWSASAAGGLGKGAIPAWVKLRHQQPPPADCVPNPSGLEYLFYDEQVNVSGAEYFSHHAYQIVSQEGLSEGAEIKILFDPEYQSVTLHRLNVWRGGKATDHADAGKFKIIQQERELSRRIYNGECTALFFIPDIRVGDVVEMASTTRGRNPIFGEHYSDEFTVSGNSPFREQTIRLIPAPGRPLTARWLGGQPRMMTEQRAGGELLWRVGATPAVWWENGAPDWFPQYPALQVSDFSSWSAVIEWVLPIYQLPSSAGKLLREQAKKFYAAADHAEARAVAAVDFVQKEVRYLGMETGAGSHRPSPPDIVLERRFGDCKDKALLLTALLRELGVAAAPVLVNTSWRGRTDELLPGTNAFDHVVVLVSISGSSWLIDATADYQAGARLADRHMGVYGSGLVVRTGESGLTKFELGRHDTGGVQIDERFIIKDYHSPVTFTVATLYRGQAADDVREEFATLSREQIARDYRDYYSKAYPSLRMTEPVKMHDDTSNNTLAVVERYEIDRFFESKQADKRKIFAEIDTLYLHSYLPRANSQGRRSPLEMNNYPRSVSVTTRVEFPDAWVVGTTERKTDTRWFSHSVSEHNVGSRIVERQHRLGVKTDTVPPEELGEYLARRKQVLDTSGVRFTHSQPPAAERVLSPKALLVILVVALGIIVSGVALVALVICKATRRSSPPPLPSENRH